MHLRRLFGAIENILSSSMIPALTCALDRNTAGLSLDDSSRSGVKTYERFLLRDLGRLSEMYLSKNSGMSGQL